MDKLDLIKFLREEKKFSFERISKELALSKQRVNFLYNKYNFSDNKKRYRDKSDQRIQLEDTWLDLYENKGLTVRGVSALTGCSFGQVYYFLKSIGCLRRRGRRF